MRHGGSPSPKHRPCAAPPQVALARAAAHRHGRWQGECAATYGDAGQRPRNDGDWEAVKSAAARVVSATYEVPYLAHAPMETENAKVRITGDRAEIRAPTQHQDCCVRDAAGRVTGFNIRGAGGSVMYDDRPGLFRNPNFMDPFALQSVTDTRYRFGAAFRAEYARVDLPPKVWLLALRRELLAHDARAPAVLDLAAARGGWGTPLAGGRCTASPSPMIAAM